MSYPFMPAPDAKAPPPLVPAYVATARAACACMADEQRVAFAIELITGITSTSCRLPLRRLITAADATATDLGRVAFARGEIV
jgi:hypothetical protein